MPTSVTLGAVRGIHVSKRGMTDSSSWVMESFVEKSGCQNSLPLFPSHSPGARERLGSLLLGKRWWLGKAHTAKVGCRGKGSVSDVWGLGWRKKAGGGVFEVMPPHRTKRCVHGLVCPWSYPVHVAAGYGMETALGYWLRCDRWHKPERES